MKEPIAPEAILPLASCKAVDNDADKAVHVSAALLAFAKCLRIFDDLVDRNRSGQLWEDIGQEIAWNYASAIYTLCFEILNKSKIPDNRFCKINQLFIDSYFILAGGQDRDLVGETSTIEDYWLTIDMKTGCAFAFACAAGAMAGTDNPEYIESCHTFGHHLGLTIQIFNDVESIWHDGPKKYHH